MAGLTEDEKASEEDRAASDLTVSDVSDYDEVVAGIEESVAHLGDGQELWGKDFNDGNNSGCPGW